MSYLASQLASLALATNFLTVITVVVCFMVMVVFIRQFRRYEIDPFSSVVRVKPQVQEQFLAKMNLPFSFRVGGNCKRLDVETTSVVPYSLVAVADLTAAEVRTLLNETWRGFEEVVQSDMKLWPNTLLHASEDVHGPKSFEILVPENGERRVSYAVTVIQAVLDVNGNPEDPAAVISLIHIPDQHCKTPVSIICQYLKFRDGRLLDLKPLYTSSDARPTEEAGQGNTNCVICWNHSSNQVLLPCRHACICVYCLKHVDTCPICRCRITSYFTVQ